MRDTFRHLIRFHVHFLLFGLAFPASVWICGCIIRSTIVAEKLAGERKRPPGCFALVTDAIAILGGLVVWIKTTSRLDNDYDIECKLLCLMLIYPRRKDSCFFHEMGCAIDPVRPSLYGRSFLLKLSQLYRPVINTGIPSLFPHSQFRMEFTGGKRGISNQISTTGSLHLPSITQSSTSCHCEVHRPHGKFRITMHIQGIPFDTVNHSHLSSSTSQTKITPYQS